MNPFEEARKRMGLPSNPFDAARGNRYDNKPDSPKPNSDGEIRQGPPFWKYKVSDVFREGAKAVGLIGGSIAGAAATPQTFGAGSVPGAGLGYATGNKAADVFDQALGVSAPAPIKSQLMQSAQDFQHGAMMEMGGQLLGPVLSTGASAVNRLFRSPTTSAEVKAGELLSKAYKQGPAETANIAKAEALQNRLGAPTKLTRAQQMGSKRAGMFEQGLSSQSEIADPLSRIDSATRQTSLERVFNTLGPGRTAPDKVAESPAGKAIITKLQAAYEPVRAAEREAYAAIPKYEMPTTELDRTIAEIKGQPLAKTAKNEFNNAVKYIRGMGKDTISLREVSKSLGNDIRKFQKTGDENTARPLRLLKAAIDGDIKALGEAAESGTIALHEGRIIYPRQIQSEILKLDESIEKSAHAAQSATSKSGLQDRSGYVNEMIADRESKKIVTLTNRKKYLENILQNAQPAEDAAAAIKNATSLSRSKFERFKKGAVGDVRQVGDEINGQRIEDEKIRRQFGTISGYRSLARAIGQDDAKDLMRSYFTNELRGGGENFNVKSALNFYRKNLEVLKSAKLDGEMREIIKGEIPNELKRKLELKRTESGTTDKPYFTAQEARSLLSEYGGILRATYGNGPVQALRDYHEILTRQGWNKNQSYSGGSISAEKFLNNPEWFLNEGDKIPHPMRRVASIFLDTLAGAGGAAAGAALHGIEGAAIGSAGGYAVRRGYVEVKKDAANRVLQLLREAVVDPDMADLLMRVAKTKNDTKASEIAMRGLAKIMATGTAMFTGRERTEQPATPGNNNQQQPE